MAKKGGIYAPDEPTAGLHLADIERLLGLLDRRVDGGRIVFEGTAVDLVAARSTLIGTSQLTSERDRRPRGGR